VKVSPLDSGGGDGRGARPIGSGAAEVGVGDGVLDGDGAVAGAGVDDLHG